MKKKRDIVLVEPFKPFKVIDSGVSLSRNNEYLVPLIMGDSELIYEKEVAPSISHHTLRALKKGIENKEFVKRMLDILSSYEFDIGSITFYLFF